MKGVQFTFSELFSRTIYYTVVGYATGVVSAGIITLALEPITVTIVDAFRIFRTAVAYGPINFFTELIFTPSKD